MGIILTDFSELSPLGLREFWQMVWALLAVFITIMGVMALMAASIQGPEKIPRRIMRGLTLGAYTFLFNYYVIIGSFELLRMDLIVITIWITVTALIIMGRVKMDEYPQKSEVLVYGICSSCSSLVGMAVYGFYYYVCRQ